MTPSQARRRILILRIAATVLYLYAIPTFIISALRMLYEKSRNIKLARLLTDLIAALYDNVFRGSKNRLTLTHHDPTECLPTAKHLRAGWVPATLSLDQ